LITALARKTLEMVDVVSRFHDHLERRNEFRAGGAVPGRAEQSANMHAPQSPFSTIVADRRPLHTAVAYLSPPHTLLHTTEAGQ